MKLVKPWEEEGVEIPKPYQRKIKVLFAPDKEGVGELTFSHAILPPQGRTDYHDHDRPELIYIVKGEGICIDNDGNKIPIKEDMAMWMPAGEKHQIINNSYEEIKLATIFIPAYTAKENYDRCKEAAMMVQQLGKKIK